MKVDFYRLNMDHERRADSREREKDAFFKIAVLGVALIIGGVKMAVDKYVAEATVECVRAGVREHDALNMCVNRHVYGELELEVPDFLLVSVDEADVRDIALADASD